MTWTPHVTAAVVVEDSHGRFLLVEEVSGGRTVINQPAGHIEEGETIVAAACREALEETGWRVEPTHFLGLYTYRAPANGVTYYRFCLIARAAEKLSDQLDSDIITTHWLDLEQIRQRREQLRSPLVLQCIEDYRNGRQFPLDVLVETQT
ncbi:MAG: NUDIX hydrolase [Marinobacter sp.]|uniref:NUDIX hydrolase n=1 Tax=Marinobacter sp. TaxID=50741 RepID=UPI00299D2412|nr:NUDIX hydrolase [Marinobacter sp.]MDX1633018.1 NUDIX hydrolase [Marinobacter sp.]